MRKANNNECMQLSLSRRCLYRLGRSDNKFDTPRRGNNRSIARGNNRSIARDNVTSRHRCRSNHCNQIHNYWINKERLGKERGVSPVVILQLVYRLQIRTQPPPESPQKACNCRYFMGVYYLRPFHPPRHNNAVTFSLLPLCVFL